MNRGKDTRISKAYLINEGLVEKDQTEEESELEEFVSAPLLSIPEAAKYLGIGRKDLYRLIDYGEINAIKAGDSLRVDMSTLEDIKTGSKRVSL
ncbi:MAG: helix-turn-helix domain-containing protein [Thermodesulfobacteriota bacterium]